MAISVSGDSNHKVITKLTDVMSLVSKWFRFNKLSVNYSKTKFMLFGSNNRKLENCADSINIGGNSIERTNTYKYLGIKLDQTLSFSNHVEYMRAKSIGKIRLLGKIALILPSNTSLFLYRSLVLPIFDYADYVWDCLSQQDALTLQKLQNMALRNILNVPRRTHTNYTHIQLHQDMLHTRRSKHTATFMYQVYKGEAPPMFELMFSKLENVRERITRANSSMQFYTPRVNLEMSKRNLRYKGVKIWELVPDDVKLAPSKHAFKRAVDKLW